MSNLSPNFPKSTLAGEIIPETVRLSRGDAPHRSIDFNIIIDIIMRDDDQALLDRIRRNPKNVRFDDLCRICDRFFGKPRQRGSSHRVYPTPWLGDPRINIQSRGGMAKAYQVRQVLAAIRLLEKDDDRDC